MGLEKAGLATQLQKSKIPEVSVCVTTYNQSSSIARALDSVLSQEVDFDYEVIVGDDYSTDGTRDILIKYQKDYPSRVYLNLLTDKGEGPPGKENFLSTLEMCRGKYIAVLEGDDYWTDKNKLEIQRKFLDSNSEFVMCHHSCKTSKEMPNNEREIFNKMNETAGFYDACQITFPFFLSVMFRKDALEGKNVRYMLEENYVGDWGLWCLVTLKGNSFYMNRIMGYYNVSSLGLSHNIPYDKYLSGRISFIEKVLNNFSGVDEYFLFRMLSKLYLLSAGNNLERRNIKIFVKQNFISAKYSLKGLSFRRHKWIKRFRCVSIINVVFFNIVNFLRGKNNYAVS